jgi:predicted ArsR family transcriptional regulator
VEPDVLAGRGRRPPVNQGQLDADVAGLASLAEPTRRALYLYVYAQDRPVSRDEAAAGVGVPRHRAKFHLDRLVDDGLLETEFARRTGRQGPGAGRPAKFYRRGARELSVTLPERNYELAGQLMARAIAEAQGEDRPVAETLQRAARERGRSLAGLAERRAGNRPSPAALLAAARGVLDDEGYETRSDPAGLSLANCPFRALAAEHTALVCGMNLAIMEGLLERLGRLPYAAVLDPAEGRCCVRLVPEGRG